MKNDELRDVLKMDFPDVEIDSKKIISTCKARNEKYNTQLMKLTYILSSFVVLVIVAVIGIILINNKLPHDVMEINNRIDNLVKFESNETKIMEIMSLEKEVQMMSEENKAAVYTDKLSYELKNTTTDLKKTASWSAVVNNEVTYFAFDEIIDTNGINELFVKKDLVSNTTIRLYRDEFTDSLLETFYLPYIDIIDNKESFYEDYKVQLSGDNNDFFSFQINDYDDANEQMFNIYVYGSGYVLITETLNNELTKAYISLIPLDYSEFKLTYGAYNITRDFYFHEVVSFDSIKSISITESTYWALLGVPATFLNDDQMLDYYNGKLKNLNFTENDELVKSIQSELGTTLDNDTYSITIALNGDDSISIFVSKTTHRFIIIHGIMTYAGVNTFDYE